MQLLQGALYRRDQLVGSSVFCTQDVEHPLEPGLVDNVADAHEIEVARRDANDQVSLGDNPEDQVVPVLALDCRVSISSITAAP